MLLLMHRKMHTLMPPGGHVELHESPWAALLHEVEEEAGYQPERLQVMQPKLRLKDVGQIVVHPQPILSNTHYISDGHYHTDLDYLLIVDGPPDKPPADGESQDLRWLNRQQIGQLSSSEILDNVCRIACYAFDVLLESEQYETIPATDFRTDTPAQPFNA